MKNSSVFNPGSPRYHYYVHTDSYGFDTVAHVVSQLQFQCLKLVNPVVPDCQHSELLLPL